MTPIRNTVLTGRTVTLALVVFVVMAGGAAPAAAHNPACHQPGHQSGPHYDKGTASETAFEHNPNLLHSDDPDSEHPDQANSIHNREGSCSTGNADS
jgi:hypothetical protein